jgi:hypothetical protein
MSSKKSRARTAAHQTDDASEKPRPERDGLLFPIEPETREPAKSDQDEPISAQKPAREELLLPSHTETKTLCDLAVQVKTIAPWTWMQDTDVFGVEDPDTGEIGFVSVMGNIGEFESVAVYRGAEGIFGYIDFQADPSASADRLLEIPEVQLSFTEPKLLEKRDRELLKGSGLKFTGTRPEFRSFRPGYVPWFITLQEARLLIHALSQTVEMTKRLASEPFLFPDDGDGETEPFLIRVARKEGPGLVWEDQIKRIQRPPIRALETTIDWFLLRDLQTLPLSTTQLEADVFIGPGSIGEPNERPLALYMLMLADRFSGYILGFEALSAEDSLDAMYASIPEKIAQLLWEKRVLPKQIIVRSDRLFGLLEPLQSELKIQLRRANELPAIEEATASMTQFLATGEM